MIDSAFTLHFATTRWRFSTGLWMLCSSSTPRNHTPCNSQLSILHHRNLSSLNNCPRCAQPEHCCHVLIMKMEHTCPLHLPECQWPLEYKDRTSPSCPRGPKMDPSFPIELGLSPLLRCLEIFIVTPVNQPLNERQQLTFAKEQICVQLMDGDAKDTHACTSRNCGGRCCSYGHSHSHERREVNQV